VLNGARRRLAHVGFVLRRRWPGGQNYLGNSSNGTRWIGIDHTCPLARKIALDALGCIGFYRNVAGLRGCKLVLAEIESGQWDWPFRDETAGLFTGTFRGVGGRRKWNRFAGGHQRPALGIFEFQIEVRHRHSAVGVPRASSTHIKQAATS